MTFARSVNYKPVIFDPQSHRYSVAGVGFSTFREAKANQWQCDKCAASFAGFKNLKRHKAEAHSY